MRNIKILVNFDSKKVVHTAEHAGSNVYQELISRGYNKVGVIKVPSADIKLFWDDAYFEPNDKYVAQ